MGEREYTVALTDDELTVLLYLVNSANCGYRDPLKDIDETGEDGPKDPYGSLRTLADKLNEMDPVA